MFKLSSSAAGLYSGAVIWENLQGEIDDGTLCNSAGGCTLSVTNSTFSSNEGHWAGAVYLDAKQAAMTIAASTFQNNSGRGMHFANCWSFWANSAGRVCLRTANLD